MGKANPPHKRQLWDLACPWVNTSVSTGRGRPGPRILKGGHGLKTCNRSPACAKMATEKQSTTTNAASALLLVPEKVPVTVPCLDPDIMPWSWTWGSLEKNKVGRRSWVKKKVEKHWANR